MTPDRSVDALLALEASQVRMFLELSPRASGILYLKGGVIVRPIKGRDRRLAEWDNMRPQLVEHIQAIRQHAASLPVRE